LFLFLIFLFGLLFFAFLSTTIIFHDTPEYLGVTKSLAGYKNIKIYSTHSFIYSLFVAQFVKVVPSFVTIKLINIMWLVLDALLLLLFFKDKRAFILWIFSPLLWCMSIQYSPILPASFFILLMYVMFLEWESTGKKFYFLVSALSGGFSFAVYEPSLLVLVFFIFSFFYKKNLISTLIFLILMLPTIALRFVVDYFLTGFPFYSIVRYFGTNLVVILGLNTGSPKGFFHGIFSPFSFYVIFMIIPLLILLFYKVGFPKDKRLLLFVLLSSLFFFTRGGLIKYFLLFSVFIIILLAPVFSKKFIVLNSIISVFLILLFTYPYFYADPASFIKEDMDRIVKDFPSPYYIDVADVSVYTWDETRFKFYRFEEYLLFLKGGEYYSDYKLTVDNKINLYQILELETSLKKNFSDDISSYPLLLKKGAEPVKNTKLLRCYNYLCIYKQV
jgi:hypothetical protein